MYSEALSMMKPNTVKYSINEMKATLFRKESELSTQNAENEMLRNLYAVISPSCSTSDTDVVISINFSINE